MADNYLENKYEEFRSGRPVIRRMNPSLDTLLHRSVEESGSTDAGNDPIRQAQLDAIVRSASILGTSCSFRALEEKGSILILSPNSPQRHIVELGEVILAMRLKAAELGFGCELELVREPLRAPVPHLATLTFKRI